MVVGRPGLRALTIENVGGGCEGGAMEQREQYRQSEQHSPFPELDVPGLIRRVRRVCDLSQRELAQRLSVSQPTVARWETGEVEPSLSMFRTLLGLADFELQVRDADQKDVAPMRQDAVRDQAGRRLPAHLDVAMFFPEWAAPAHTHHRQRFWCTPGRWDHDYHRRRARKGEAPPDHPYPSEVDAFIADARWMRGMRRRYDYRLFEAWRKAQGYVAPECECPDACFVADYCVAECACRCDALDAA